MATKEATAKRKSTSASPIPAKMELHVETLSARINVIARRVFKGKIANTTSMTACPILAKTTEFVTIWSTISNVLAPMAQ